MKNKLSLLLLEASLETVPLSISHHPAIVKTAARRGKKPTSIILDISLHYHAMRKLDKVEKRGRPDIVHVSLLEALESPISKRGLLRVYVHTIEGHVLFIEPATRIPRNYNRFVGLMEQLFETGSVPPGGDKPLIYIKTMKLSNLLEQIEVNGLILLNEKCSYLPLYKVTEQALAENMAIGVGAFPHGDFEKETLDQTTHCYSIYSEPLSTHIVVSRILSSAERLLGIIEL
ncbi:MAG: 16S rRNA methyltransferase [Desulfurococcaceae archaeon]